MVKNNKFMYMASSAILFLNMVFWWMIAIKYAQWTDYHLVYKLLMFLQAIIYMVGLWGVWHKQKSIYWGIVLFAILNTGLSFSFNNYLVRFIFVFSALAGSSLLLLYKDFVIKKK